MGEVVNLLRPTHDLLFRKPREPRSGHSIMVDVLYDVPAFSGIYVPDIFSSRQQQRSFAYNNFSQLYGLLLRWLTSCRGVPSGARYMTALSEATFSPLPPAADV